ncbi:MAG: SDR family NAD(P)-dependent oxidoreductase [Pseudomonadota bacterium]
MTTHPALQAGGTAVITGAASGIGLAAAERFASLGLKVCMADINGDELEKSAAQVAKGAANGDADVMHRTVDVSDRNQLAALQDSVIDRFGSVSVLMNNAGAEPRGRALGDEEVWQRVLSVNLWGVVHGSQVFAPGMIEAGKPAVIINTGSKQGITCPPGNAAYNVSKAGVKVFTEQLAHELRSIEGCQVGAALLIPGFTFTGFTRVHVSEKPAGAWNPEQVVDELVAGLGRGDFYILCEDNEVTRDVDNKRIIWAAQDITENRAPLSRWHPDYGDAFSDYMND